MRVNMTHLALAEMLENDLTVQLVCVIIDIPEIPRALNLPDADS